MKCEVAAGGRWNLKDRASGVLVADKQSKGESGRERMEDVSRGNPFCAD
jgi:hypothetical protein